MTDTAYSGSGYPQSVMAAVTIDYSQTEPTLHREGLPQGMDLITAAAIAFSHEIIAHGLGAQTNDAFYVSSPLQTPGPTFVPSGDESRAREYERRFIAPGLGVAPIR